MAADATSSVYSQNLKGDLNAPYINAENVQSNMKVIYYSRTFMSIVGGIIAGILGFTGLTGFIFYFLVMAVTSVGLTAKAKFSIHSYFDSWNRILLDGFLGGLMSFVLFWTIPRVSCSLLPAGAVNLCTYVLIVLICLRHCAHLLMDYILQD